MNDQIDFGGSAPPQLLDNEPCTLIYDPGKRIKKDMKKLYPFGPMVCTVQNVEDWAKMLNKSSGKRWIILLIFPTQTEVEIREFIMQYVSDRSELHSLYLIFHNGLQYHAQWSNTLLTELVWCRSITNRLFHDIREVCAGACQIYVSYYEQQRRQAEYDIKHNNNGARGIARIYAEKKREHVHNLCIYWTSMNSS
ncbi:hypothetical protein I4U23_020382 [Adineta vaga]|nr:hypothetical protein I4U23_020382 [Adineta vaga]